MRKFFFRLDRVRHLRELEEQALRRDVASVYRDLALIGDERDRLQRSLVDSCEHRGLRSLVIAWRERVRSALDELEQREDRLCRRAALLISRLERARGRVKALERLREKRLKRYHRRCRAREEDGPRNNSLPCLSS